MGREVTFKPGHYRKMMSRSEVAASFGLRANPRSRILSCFPSASGLSPEP